jgi:hypothetical protein
MFNIAQFEQGARSLCEDGFGASRRLPPLGARWYCGNCHEPKKRSRVVAMAADY